MTGNDKENPLGVDEMIKIRPDHNVETKNVKGAFVDGLYVAQNDAIYATVKGRGKAHFAMVAGSITLCNRGTKKMGLTHSLAARSKPVNLCKHCENTAKSVNMRLIPNGWYDVATMTRLYSHEMIKDGQRRLLTVKGLKPFYMAHHMNNPYIAALMGGDRLPLVDTKVYHESKRQMTDLDDLHDTVLIDLIDKAAKNQKVRLEFMRFYPVTSAFDFGGTDFVKSVSEQLELARALFGYDLLEVGVLMTKPVGEVTLYHNLAFKVSDKNGSGVVALSGVPYNAPPFGNSSAFDQCMNMLTTLLKVKLGSMQKWII